MSAAPKHQRFESIIESDFAKSLGEPTDFPGERRFMFSLDNSSSSQIVSEKTLPKILSLIEDIVDKKLKVQVCEGAYRYKDGTLIQEVSFLVKLSSMKLLDKLEDYLRHNTRQESILVISRENIAILGSLHHADDDLVIEGCKVTSNILGEWMQVPEEVAKIADAYTRIGNLWFVCVPYKGRKPKGERHD